jgi:hypothetical protein
MPVRNPLNISETGFIVVECLHIAGFVLAIGMTAILDFRLLGLILRQQSPAQLAADTSWWMLGGLIVAVFTGFLLFSTDPDMYYTSKTFLIKMACLSLAIIVNYTIHRKAVSPGVSPGHARLAACMSLALWVSTVMSGIFIATDLLDFS